MDDLELTELFVERRKLMDKMTAIDVQITQEVMRRGATFSAAGVRASYYNPSKKFDYMMGAAAHPRVDQDLIKAHTTLKESVSWKNVCLAAEIPEDEIPFEEVPARVVVK